MLHAADLEHQLATTGAWTAFVMHALAPRAHATGSTHGLPRVRPRQTAGVQLQVAMGLTSAIVM